MTQDFELAGQTVEVVLVRILEKYSDDVRTDKNVVVAVQGNRFVLTAQSGAERAKQNVLLTGKR